MIEPRAIDNNGNGHTYLSEKPAPSLTRRQEEIFQYLKETIQNRGYAPTVREIGEHFRIRSPNGVMCHLKALERKGMIRRESHMSRAICLAQNSAPTVSLRSAGTAVSGGALREPAEADNTVEFSRLLDSDANVCLRIQGHEFQSLGIKDGDFVVIRQTETPRESPSTLVAAVDDKQSVMLCYATEDASGSLQLIPAVPNVYPRPMDSVIGIVVGVIRQFPRALEGAGAQASEGYC